MSRTLEPSGLLLLSKLLLSFGKEKRAFVLHLGPLLAFWENMRAEGYFVKELVLRKKLSRQELKKDFKAIFKAGQNFCQSKDLVVYKLEKNSSHFRSGFQSVKAGNAVVRNSIKAFVMSRFSTF